jgi:hypothetical protein
LELNIKCSKDKILEQLRYHADTNTKCKFNFNLLGKELNTLERRQSPRLKLSGAYVIYKLDKGRYSLKLLYDLTKSHARFEIDHKVELGDRIELIFIIPKKEKIYIKARVLRVSDPVSEFPPYAVVQFLPFGKDERYNSMKCFNQLQKLIDEFLLSEELAGKISLTRA